MNRRKISWLALLLVLSIAAFPGFMVLKGSTFSKKSLGWPNPTSYVFDSPASGVRSAIDDSISSAYQQGRLYGYWVPSGLSFHGDAEREYDLHEVALSDKYFWWNTPLEYSADFKLVLSPVSDSRTRVDILTSGSKVRIGPNFGGHGGDYDEPVAPTTIEEYRVLLEIGASLREPGMPVLQLPL